MKFAVLVFTMNSLEVTSMVFSSMEKGLEKVKELTGKKMEKVTNEKGEVTYELDVYDELNSSNSEEDVNEEFAEKFFTGYYPGCGEAGSMILKEVEEGTSFCEWDLD